MQKITTELKLTTGGLLEFIVLKILSKKTSSINEIWENLKSVGFQTPTGSLYPLMSILRKKDYVTNGYEESETGGALKTYDLTERGRHRLSALRSDWARLSSLIAEIGKSY